jgi:hypothetical protein
MRQLARAGAALVALAASCAPAAAQQSANYRLTESAFNQGGDPRNGSQPASLGYRISADAIGSPIAAVGMTSAGYQSDAGFVVAYPPPLEVLNLRFTDAVTLDWSAALAAGTYNLYRDPLSTLPGIYGACLQLDLTTTGTTDAGSPVTGAGFFYLVTVANRIDEEGTKGFRSSGAERANPSPCP